jgi:hypothetical protein
MPDTIYLIERYNSCDDEYCQIGFTTTVEDADAVISRLQAKVEPCKMCGRSDLYDYRKMKQLS